MKNSPSITKHRNGFTLLELIIVSAIFSVVILAIGSLFVSAEQGYEFTLNTYTLEINTAKATSGIVDLLKAAQVIAIETHEQSKAAIVFQIPVDWDNDGDVIDDNNNVEWGATWPNYNPPTAADILNQIYVIRCVQDMNSSRYYKEPEGYHNVDFNGDGDQDDIFLRVDLVLELFQDRTFIFEGVDDQLLVSDVFNTLGGNSAPGKLQSRLLAENLATVDEIDLEWQGPGTPFNPATEMAFDLDGDGLGDTMFSGTLSAGQLTRLDFTVAAFVRDTHGSPMRKVRKLSIDLRNRATEDTKLYENLQRYDNQ